LVGADDKDRAALVSAEPDVRASDSVAVRVAIAERLVRWTLPAMLLGWMASVVILLTTQTPPTRLYASLLWFVALVISGSFAYRKQWLRASGWLCVGLAVVTGTSTLINGVHSFGFIGNLVLMALVVPLFGARWGTALVAWALSTGGMWLWLDQQGLGTGVRYPSAIQALIFTCVLLLLVMAVLTAPTRMLAQALRDAQERLLALGRAREEERKAAIALQRASERLGHAERLEAMGQLSGGVAHDFNNMLSAISGATELIASTRERGQDRDMDANIDMLREATQRAANLTRKLLAFGRKDRIESRQVDLNALISEVATLARAALGGRVRLLLELSHEPLLVWIDRSAMEHALLNLVLNARDAMPTGGEITITTREATLDRTFCEGTTFDVKPGQVAHITIADTGQGMPPEVMAHIFEPFFTTKAEGSGTGLGLSTVHGTVVSHRGAIEVYSSQGNGCAFHLYLPLHQNAPAVGAADGASTPSAA